MLQGSTVLFKVPSPLRGGTVSALKECKGVSAMSCLGAPPMCHAETLSVLEWRDGVVTAGRETSIINEYRIQVNVDGQVCMSIMCTPGDDTALVVGRLFTEGFIDGADEVESIDYELVGPSLSIAHVALASRRDDLVETPEIDVPSVGAGSQVWCRYGSRVPRESYLTRGEFKPWRVSEVLQLDRLFSRDSPLHKLTGGTHSCYLMRDGVVLRCAEDIGRHNTVDKAIGWALLNRVDLSEVMAFISGRVPTDMMLKAVRAKFRAFVSRKLPTREAIEMARHYRVTLVGDVAKGHLKVFSGLSPSD